jgi:hypothetical protein
MRDSFWLGSMPSYHLINPTVVPAIEAAEAMQPSKPVLRKHGKLIAFFRSFILNRPSRRRLKQTGILKERVFGCDLGEHLQNSGNESELPSVPVSRNLILLSPAF